MKQRIITAIILLAIFVPCVVIGGYPWQAIMVFVGAMAGFELLSICDGPKAKIYLYPLLIFYILYSIFMPNELLIPVRYITLFLMALLVAGIFDYGMPLLRLSYYFMSATLVALGLHMIYFMRAELGLNYILFLAFATLGADTGAYFVGRKFGKHKLNPRLSPKKTIEGSIGGTVVGTILACIFAYLSKMNLPLAAIIIMSLVLSTTGQIGDLSFSSIKRTFEVKDYSQIFPGHGGVLDRFDSIIFNAMVLGLLMQYLTMFHIL